MKQMKKMMLEDYLVGYTVPPSLSRHHLNEIIEMHDFVKLHNHHKKLVLKCTESIHLAEPARSTVEDAAAIFSSSSPVLLQPDSLTADLQAIGWRDCRVRTVQTLSTGTTPTIAATSAVAEAPQREAEEERAAGSAGHFRDRREEAAIGEEEEDENLDQRADGVGCRLVVGGVLVCRERVRVLIPNLGRSFEGGGKGFHAE